MFNFYNKPEYSERYNELYLHTNYNKVDNGMQLRKQTEPKYSSINKAYNVLYLFIVRFLLLHIHYIPKQVQKFTIFFKKK